MHRTQNRECLAEKAEQENPRVEYKMCTAEAETGKDWKLGMNLAASEWQP